MRVFGYLADFEYGEPAANYTLDPNNPARFCYLVIGYTERVGEPEYTVAERAPKVGAYDRPTRTEGAWKITESAGILGTNF